LISTAALYFVFLKLSCRGFCITGPQLPKLTYLKILFSKSVDEKMITYKKMTEFAADEKDLKTFILDDLKVL